MIEEFVDICDDLDQLIRDWEIKLSALPQRTISLRRNSQNRSIRQIVGHMVDSASNNTHRIIHMHYQESPVKYPDYANLGNNEQWIAIQNYQEEDWKELVKLWTAANRHLVHVIRQVDESRLNIHWISALNEKVTLRAMIHDYRRHFKLHLDEITALINQLTIDHD